MTETHILNFHKYFKYFPSYIPVRPTRNINQTKHYTIQNKKPQVLSSLWLLIED